MIASVVEHGAQSRYGVAREHAVGQAFDKAFFDGGDILFGNASADDFFGEFEIPVEGFEAHLAVPVLAVSARLFLVFAFRFDRLSDRLFIGDFWRFEQGGNVEFRFKFFVDDVEVRFALTADDHFARVCVFGDGEGVVFFGKFVKPLEDLVFLTLFLGIDRHGEDGAGEVYGIELHLCVFVAEGVARVGGGKFAHGADVARGQFGNGFLLFAFEQVDLADAFGFTRRRIVDGRAGFQASAEDLHDVHFADEGVDDRLEHLCGEGSVLGAGDADELVFVGGRCEHFPAFFRAGHILYDLVHEVDDASVLKGGTRHDGDGVDVVDALADAVDDLVFGEGAFLEVFVEECLVILGGGLGQACLHFREGAFEILGNGDGFFLRLVGEAVAGLFERVDVADHFVSFHDRDLDRRDLARVFFGERGDGAFVVGVFLVRAVDEDDHGDLCFQAGVDALFGTDGKRSRRARDDERAACRAERLVAFPFEVIEPGNVEEVEFDSVPHGVCH